MTYWTVLWITVLGGYLDGGGIAIPYESRAQCEAALPIVSETLPYDHNIRCHETEIASGSIRPKARP